MWRWLYLYENLYVRNLTTWMPEIWLSGMLSDYSCTDSPFLAAGKLMVWQIRGLSQNRKSTCNRNLVRIRFRETSISVVQTLRNFAQSTAVWLLCLVQNFSMYRLFKMWVKTNVTLVWDFSFRGISDGLVVLQWAACYQDHLFVPFIDGQSRIMGRDKRGIFGYDRLIQGYDVLWFTYT